MMLSCHLKPTIQLNPNPPFRFKFHVHVTNCCIREQPKRERRSNEKEANVLAVRITEDESKENVAQKREQIKKIAGVSENLSFVYV